MKNKRGVDSRLDERRKTRGRRAERKGKDGNEEGLEGKGEKKMHER